MSDSDSDQEQEESLEEAYSRVKATMKPPGTGVLPAGEGTSTATAESNPNRNGDPETSLAIPKLSEPIQSITVTGSNPILLLNPGCTLPYLQHEQEETVRQLRAVQQQHQQQHQQLPQQKPNKPTDTMVRRADDLRFYYKNNLVNLSPVPCLQNGTLELDDYFTELIIKQISNFGKDIRAKNDIDFRSIFNNTTGLSNRILVEGSPGYGKTTLARRVAVDWGRKADYLEHYQLVIFVTCRDLNGRNLETYVAETFPKCENRGESIIRLRDWVRVSDRLLFILDGLDECSSDDAHHINELVEGTGVYLKASILATSRPLGEETDINLHQFSRKVEIKGFNRERIEKLIDVFFRDKAGKGEELKKKLFSGIQAYRNLATCPLLCQLFCLLYEDDEKLPNKVTDVYYNLIKCLIRRERSIHGNGVIAKDDLPARYELTLRNFGKMCIDALIHDKFYFTREEIVKVLPENISKESDVIMGFLVKSSTTPYKSIFDQQVCYQPLHKTFLEFVAGFYLKCLVNNQEFQVLEDELTKIQAMEHNSVEQMLHYAVEMLGKDAYHILSRVGNIIDLKDTTNLRLLNAADCFTDANIQALTSVMNLESVEVKCSLKEMEAWTSICTKSEVIKQLKFSWEPRLDSLSEEKVRNFFEEVMTKNTSIETVTMSMFHGTLKSKSDPNYQEEQAEFHSELVLFGEAVRKMMCKANLKHLEVEVQTIQLHRDSQVDYVEPILSNIVNVFLLKGSSICLESLTLNFDMSSEKIARLVDVLANYEMLEKLSLPRLCCDIQGFHSLARYLLLGTLKDLEVKLNVTKFWFEEVPEGYTSQLRDPSESLGRKAFASTEEHVQIDSAIFQNTGRKALEKCHHFLKGINGNLKRDCLDWTVQETFEVDDLILQTFHLKNNGIIWPLPICAGHTSSVSGFHYLFSALRDPKCKLERFYLNQCLFHRQAEYFACLGEVILDNTTIKELKVDNIFHEQQNCDIKHAFPLILSLRVNTTLTSLDLGSLRFDVDNLLLGVLCESLAANTSLQVLNIARWKFNLDFSNASGLVASLRKAFSQTNLRSLIMEECDLTMISTLPKEILHNKEDLSLLYSHLCSLTLTNNTLEILNIANLHLVIDKIEAKPRDFLHVLGFSNLKELNVSESAEVRGPGSPIINCSSMPDENLLGFLDALRLNMPRLEILKMVNWAFRQPHQIEFVKRLKPLLLALPRLKKVSLNNFQLVTVPSSSERSNPMDSASLFNTSGPLLLKSLIKYLPNLKLLSLLRSNISEEQVPILVKAVKHRVLRNQLELHTKHMDYRGLNALLSELEISKSVSYSYDQQSGVLTLQAKRPPGLTGRVQYFNDTVRRSFSHQVLSASFRTAHEMHSGAALVGRLSTPLLRLRGSVAERRQPQP